MSELKRSTLEQHARISSSSEAFNDFQLPGRLGRIGCLSWRCYWEITDGGFGAFMTSCVLRGG